MHPGHGVGGVGRRGDGGVGGRLGRPDLRDGRGQRVGRNGVRRPRAEALARPLHLGRVLVHPLPLGGQPGPPGRQVALPVGQPRPARGDGGLPRPLRLAAGHLLRRAGDPRLLEARLGPGEGRGRSIGARRRGAGPLLGRRVGPRGILGSGPGAPERLAGGVTVAAGRRPPVAHRSTAHGARVAGREARAQRRRQIVAVGPLVLALGGHQRARRRLAAPGGRAGLGLGPGAVLRGRRGLVPPPGPRGDEGRAGRQALVLGEGPGQDARQLVQLGARAR